jgi:lysophospholipase L1-like esterase
LAPAAPDSALLAFGDSLTFGTGANETRKLSGAAGKLTARRVVRGRAGAK